MFIAVPVRRPAALSVALACALFAASAFAQDAPFYQGKSVNIIVSTGEGGTYSLNARTLARHMPRHLAGQPRMVVQNMPGGGHMLATNYLYTVAAKDGTVIGTVNQTVPSHQALGGKGVRYDAARFNWLGGFGSGNAVLAVWHTVGIRSCDDLRTREITTGAPGEGSSAYRYALVLNRVLGARLRIVKGYKSVPELELAMSRGEVDSRAGGYSSYVVSHADWLRDKKIVFPVQIGARRDRDLPDVPLWEEVAKTDEERRILRLVAAPIALGRPFLAPPEVPAARVAQLRKALADTSADKEFLAEAARQKLDIVPMTAEEVAAIVQETVSASPDIVAKAKAAMDATRK